MDDIVFFNLINILKIKIDKYFFKKITIKIQKQNIVDYYCDAQCNRYG